MNPFDTTHVPDDPYAKVGAAYSKALARSRRNTLEALETHIVDGWTSEQHRHWVETGEEPKK
jgi:hypothetical protein